MGMTRRWRAGVSLVCAAAWILALPAWCAATARASSSVAPRRDGPTDTGVVSAGTNGVAAYPPALVQGRAGEYLVAAMNGTALNGAIVAADGATVTALTGLPTDTGSRGYPCAAAYDPVTQAYWLAYSRLDGTQPGLYAVTVNAATRQVGTPFAIRLAEAGQHYVHPHLAVNTTTGDVLVAFAQMVYQASYTGPGASYAILCDSAGAVKGSLLTLRTDTSYAPPAVAYNPDRNEYLAVYATGSQHGAGRRIGAAGAFAAAAVSLGGSQYELLYVATRRKYLLVSGATRAVVWLTGSDGSYSGTWFPAYASTASELAPCLALATGGQAGLVWAGQRDGVYAVYGQVANEGGGPAFDPDQAVTATAEGQRYAAAAAGAGESGFYTAWCASTAVYGQFWLPDYGRLRTPVACRTVYAGQRSGYRRVRVYGGDGQAQLLTTLSVGWNDANPVSTMLPAGTYRLLGFVDVNGNQELEPAAEPWGEVTVTVPLSGTQEIPIAELDADADGLPDWWETEYLGTTGADPAADDDGDGSTNAEEYAQQTDPANAASAANPYLSFQLLLRERVRENADASLTTLGWQAEVTVLSPAGDALVGATLTPLARRAAMDLEVTGDGAGAGLTRAYDTFEALAADFPAGTYGFELSLASGRVLRVRDWLASYTATSPFSPWLAYRPTDGWSSLSTLPSFSASSWLQSLQIRRRDTGETALTVDGIGASRYQVLRQLEPQTEYTLELRDDVTVGDGNHFVTSTFLDFATGSAIRLVLDLPAGRGPWRLLGSPVTSASLVGNVFLSASGASQLAGGVVYVWGEGDAYVALSDAPLPGCQGFWAAVAASAGTVTKAFTGTVPEGGIQLGAGWNLVSPPRTLAVADLPAHVGPVWGWDGAAYFQVDGDPARLPEWQVRGKLMLGYGYWVCAP